VRPAASDKRLSSYSDNEKSATQNLRRKTAFFLRKFPQKNGDFAPQVLRYPAPRKYPNAAPHQNQAKNP
jgi:hypothetical protein